MPHRSNWGWGLIALVVAPGWMQAQSFEVASVRPTQHGRTADGWSRSSAGVKSPGNFAATNSSLDELIRWAYQLRDYQVSGPPWLNDDSECFDIQGKAPATTSAADMRVMVQSLLAERFGMKVHWDKRTMAVLALTTAKGGPKLEPAKADGQPGISWMGRKMTADRISMEALATSLSRQLKQIVVNRTELTGSYAMALEYGPDDTGPTIFSALQPFGLRLEAAKAPVEILVVDHIEKKPTEN